MFWGFFCKAYERALMETLVWPPQSFSSGLLGDRSGYLLLTDTSDDGWNLGGASRMSSLRDMCLIFTSVALIHFEKWIWRIGAGRFLVAQIGWWKIMEELRWRNHMDTRLLKWYGTGWISSLILLRHNGRSKHLGWTFGTLGDSTNPELIDEQLYH